MELRVFSVVGEALNFGARRMETIMRVAWLPVTLVLVLNMAMVFAVLSVANERVISFADLAGRIPYSRAVAISQQALLAGLAQGSAAIWITFIATALTAGVLQASFMAPLVRYAGLGERPAPGVVRLAFGPDQIRFLLAGIVSSLFVALLVFAPISVAGYWTFQYVGDALAQVYVDFPNPESLHTIKVISAEEAFKRQGSLWVYQIGLPLAALAPFAALFWFILVIHFHPRNRGRDPQSANFLGRAFFILFAIAGATALIWIGLGVISKLPPNSSLFLILSAATPLFQAIYNLSRSLTADYLALASLILLILGYFGVRLAPYVGIAVCRRSMAPAGLLRVSKGWNVVNLLAALALAALFIGLVQFVINAYAFGFIAMTVNTLYQATLTATKLANSGEAADWVLPAFIWIWNGLKIVVNFLLIFFSSGVAAGLLGRLYRESERGPA